jgi:hypothetical protein
LYPDFIGIGAQKAGTTWLSHNLQLHPGIWMPRIREIHYFNEKISDPANIVLRLSRRLFGKRVVDRRWRRQVSARTRQHLETFSREDFYWDLKYYVGAPGDEWYASLFEPGRGRVVGEITPAYSMLEPGVIAHVYEMIPWAKIVFLMRNPIERAWSQTVMQFQKTKERAIDTVAGRKLRRTFEREGSRLRTDYLRTLENWGAFYPEEQIFVGFLEDIHFFPEELLSRLYGFLGVDPSFRPPGMGRRVHSRSASQVPMKSVIYLARAYRDEITRLGERFGGYASFWLYCAERLIEDPPKGKFIPYPLWESAIWEEWVDGSRANSRRPQLQSAPLPAVRTA